MTHDAHKSKMTEVAAFYDARVLSETDLNARLARAVPAGSCTGIHGRQSNKPREDHAANHTCPG